MTSTDATHAGSLPVQPLRISIFGATGRLGTALLDLVAATPQRFAVDTLTANFEVGRLGSWGRRVKARSLVVADAEALMHLRDLMRCDGLEVAAGDKAMARAAALRCDLVVIAVPGLAALPLALAAAATGATVAICDARVLAIGGTVLQQLCRAAGGVFLALDPIVAAAQMLTAEVDLTAAGTSLHLVSGAAADRPTDPLSDCCRLIATQGLCGVAGDGIKLGRSLAGWEGAIAMRPGHADSALATAATAHQLAADLLARMGAGARRSTAWSATTLATDFATVDEDHLPMLHLARQAIRQGGTAAAILCAAYDVAAAAAADQRIDDHQVAVVVRNTMAALVTVERQRVASATDAIEAADLAARTLAYDLLDA